jgi:hypothetical protein
MNALHGTNLQCFPVHGDNPPSRPSAGGGGNCVGIGEVRGGRVWLVSPKTGGRNGVGIGGCAEARPAEGRRCRQWGGGNGLCKEPRPAEGRQGYSLGMSAFLKRSGRKNDSLGKRFPHEHAR